MSVILWIREHFANAFLNTFFQCWNFIDTLNFAIILVAFCWIVLGKGIGKKIFFAVVISSILNTLVKDIFQVPRPFVVNPDVFLLHIRAYSFPSGAAQSSILIPGLIYYTYRKKSVLALCIVWGFLLSFSRVYLGVHYPVDILGGWILGAIQLSLFILYYDRIQGFFSRRSSKSQYLLAHFLPFLTLFIYPFSKFCTIAPVIMGVCYGMCVKVEFKINRYIHLFLALASIVILICAIKLFHSPYITVICYYLIGLSIANRNNVYSGEEDDRRDLVK